MPSPAVPPQPVPPTELPATTAFSAPGLQPAIQASFVRGYKAACEDNDLDVPSEGDIAKAGKGRL